MIYNTEQCPQCRGMNTEWRRYLERICRDCKRIYIPAEERQKAEQQEAERLAFNTSKE